MENSQIKDSDVDELLEHMWTIHESNFVHSTFMNHWILREIVKTKKHLTAKWNARTTGIEKKTWHKLINDKEKIKSRSRITQSQKTGIVESTSNKVSPSILSHEVRKTKSSISILKDHDFRFFKNENQIFELKLTAHKSSVIVPNSILSVFTKDDALVKTYSIPRNDQVNTYNLTDLPKGEYRLNFRVRRCKVSMELEVNSPFLYATHLKCTTCPSSVSFLPSHKQEQIIAQLGKKKNDNNSKAINLKPLIMTSGLETNFETPCNSNFETLNGIGTFKF